jgi:hypothetical protein
MVVQHTAEERNGTEKLIYICIKWTLTNRGMQILKWRTFTGVIIFHSWIVNRTKKLEMNFLWRQHPEMSDLSEINQILASGVDGVSPRPTPRTKVALLRSQKRGDEESISCASKRDVKSPRLASSCTVQAFCCYDAYISECDNWPDQNTVIKTG